MLPFIRTMDTWEVQILPYNGQKCRSFTVRNLETNEVADDGGMSEAYLLDKLAEAKDAAGLTQL